MQMKQGDKGRIPLGFRESEAKAFEKAKLGFFSPFFLFRESFLNSA